MKVITATIYNLEQLVPLFDGFRVFYKQASNPDAVRNFLNDRFLKQDSVIFLCLDSSEKALGFTQLYPSFSSVSMQRVYILNDLFVTSEARKQGVGEALMERAKQFGIKEGCRGITLETDADNPAQTLYKKLGWKKDDHVNHYTWEV
ncbi:acetyltransferase [Aequorivita sublithincola DSM 14238]|uniref:Acetyltransferase n=1 Tax=Aequorivita sublithincola (strain DSM 14238 / LMG 21431 / ACAM 643 / 9-3) TaxID=746697 RepID=I3YS08_AEQSU|nr:GNAT family N-acetyltransferase [Aequorivita sublithincola]AFL79776.1 acetyltransferase [Aequorivita sublithincola DSM 14238]